jgi:prepilin-type N-terminal cleavage/methylation domain-containing protein
MNYKLRENRGFSLVELMVAVAISGISALAISTVYTNYTQQKYAIESKGAAQSDIETASKFLRVNLPTIIFNTTGPDGTTDLPANWWNCVTFPNICVLSSYLTADKTASDAVTQIISAECTAITDPALKNSSIHTFARDSDIAASNPGDCLTCPQGMMPQLVVTTFGNSSNKLVNNFRYLTIPSVPNKIQPGTIATGLCFNHAGYQYNKGTSAAPSMVTRYDRWTFTLTAVYLKSPIPPNATGAQVDSVLAKITERVMVSAPQQLGTDINFIPNR